MIIEDGEIKDRIYIRQRSHSTSKDDWEYFSIILNSMEYQGDRLFIPEELEKIQAQIPGTYMQSRYFFLIIMFGPFNLIMFTVLILMSISGKQPNDLYSTGIIPIVEEKMDIYVRSMGKKQGWVSYVVLTSQEIRIYLFCSLKYQINLQDPQNSIKIVKNRKIEIKTRGSKQWLIMVPDDIDKWKPYIK